MTYKYENLEDYKKFKLTRKDHNEILTNRKQNIFTKIEAYYKEDKIKLYYTTNILGKILVTLLLPFTVFAHGFFSIKEIIEDYRDLFREKKSGNYTNENVLPALYDGSPNKRFYELKQIYESQNKELFNP